MDKKLKTYITKWSPNKAQDVRYASLTSSSCIFLTRINETFPSLKFHFAKIREALKIICASFIRWQYVCTDVNLCEFATIDMSLNTVLGVGSSKLYNVQYAAVELFKHTNLL